MHIKSLHLTTFFPSIPKEMPSSSVTSTSLLS